MDALFCPNPAHLDDTLKAVRPTTVKGAIRKVEGAPGHDNIVCSNATSQVMDLDSSGRCVTIMDVCGGLGQGILVKPREKEACLSGTLLGGNEASAME